MRANFETPLDPYFEVEWLDENGSGHQITFALRDEESMNAFIKAIEPICAMLALYKVWKQRL